MNQHQTTPADDFMLAWSYVHSELSAFAEAAFESRLDQEPRLAELVVAAVRVSEAAARLRAAPAATPPPALSVRSTPVVAGQPRAVRSRSAASVVACLTCLCLLLLAVVVGPELTDVSETPWNAALAADDPGEISALLQLYQFQSSVDAGSDDAVADSDIESAPGEIDVPQWLLVAVELETPVSGVDGQRDALDDREAY